MKALMSDKLRQIIRDPKANKELEDGISRLSASKCENNSAEISVGERTYKIKFIQPEKENKEKISSK